MQVRDIRSILNMRILVLLVSVVPVLAQAQLSWLNQHQEFKATPTDKNIKAVYGFTNSGGYAVTINEVKPTCGCTTATLAKRLYAPGEGGAIETTFKFGNRKGHQSKTIRVMTDDKQQPVSELKLIVDIPALLTVKPKLLYWRVGEGDAPGWINISTGSDEWKVTGVKPASPHFSAKLEPLGSREYQVAVTPLDLTKPINSRLVIVASNKAGEVRQVEVYLRVMAEPAQKTRLREGS